MNKTVITINHHVQHDFLFPSTQIVKGQMTRFWIQMIPSASQELSGDQIFKRFQSQLLGIKPNPNIHRTSSFYLAKKRIKRNWWQTLYKSTTVYNFLRSKYKMNERTIQDYLTQFDLKKDYSIHKLDACHQKVFAILCSFQERDFVMFDYYGLGPKTEEQLTNFVLSQLKYGKTAIGFDNFMYLDENTLERKDGINNILVHNLTYTGGTLDQKIDFRIIKN